MTLFITDTAEHMRPVDAKKIFHRRIGITTLLKIIVKHTHWSRDLISGITLFC